MTPDPSGPARLKSDGDTPDRARVESMNETWHPADGHLVHAVEWNNHAITTSDRRPTVVLVHGLGGSTVNWELVGHALAHRLAARVVAFDLAGFGRTALGSRRATLGANGRLLAELVAGVGPSIIVGNSMGGALGVGLAARRPDLVRALVLVDPALPRPLRPPGVRESIGGFAHLGGLAAAAIPVAGPHLVRYRMRQLGPAGTVDASLRIVCAHPSRVDSTVRRHMVELTAYRAAGADSARAYHDAILSLVRYTTLRMPADVRAVSAPTLVIHGDRDRLVPLSVARSAVRRRADWDLEVFGNCGHVPMIEQPDRFVSVASAWLEGRLDSGDRYDAAGGVSR
jgi:pimeloyl-ACP methyl ester carboxylesterase